MFKKSPNYKPTSRIRNSERKQLVNDLTSRFEYDASLLPAEIEATLFVTSKGQKGQLYSADGHALFIKFEQCIVPTLHVIWRAQSMLPTVLTGSQVLPKLQAGSDLMVKGMFNFSPDVRQGDVVAIHVNDRDHAVAVGVAALDFKDINDTTTGKGLLLITCIGDALHPGIEMPIKDEGVETKETEESVPTDAMAVLDIEKAASSMTTEKVDQAFVQALLYGLHDKTDLSLPMSSSTLMDMIVLPYLPSHPDLQIKKTSWKKATKFISKQSILKSKEQKGQVSVTSIEWDAAQLKSFKPYPLQMDEPEKPVPKTEKHELIDIVDLYKPKEVLKDIVETKNLLSISDLHDALGKYATDHNLVNENPKMITIDAVLYHTLKPTSSQKQLSRDVLVKCMQRCCDQYHSINAQKPRKGAPQKIILTTESRQGRKQVTKVSHLERYFATKEVQDLMDTLKRKCAGAVSLGEVKGSKPGTTVEIQIQGQKVQEAKEVLLGRVPASLIVEA